jgi:hypothetical protein
MRKQVKIIQNAVEMVMTQNFANVDAKHQSTGYELHLNLQKTRSLKHLNFED